MKTSEGSQHRSSDTLTAESEQISYTSLLHLLLTMNKAYYVHECFITKKQFL